MLRTCVFLGVSSLMVSMAMAGCVSPAPLIGLHPLDPGSIWIAGRETVQKRQDDVRVAAAFEQQDGDNLAIRVEVENQRDQQIEIDPSNVTFVTCKDQELSSCGRARRVINPEQMIEQLDKQQSRNTAQADSDAAFYGPLLLLSVVGDVATIASGKGSDSGFHPSEIAHHMETSAIRHETASQNIASQRQVWSNVALRRNTIFPGNGTGGLVYLPIDTNARFVWVFVRPVGGKFTPFCFEQTVKDVY